VEKQKIRTQERHSITSWSTKDRHALYTTTESQIRITSNSDYCWTSNCWNLSKTSRYDTAPSCM